MIYNGITVDCTFYPGVSILSGYSGDGKSLLMKAVELYCLNKGISCQLCDYNMNLEPEDIMYINCMNHDVILLDNTDLYLTQGLLDRLKRFTKFIIISIKDTWEQNFAVMPEYMVQYSNGKVTIKGY